MKTQLSKSLSLLLCTLAVLSSGCSSSADEPLISEKEHEKNQVSDALLRSSSAWAPVSTSDLNSIAVEYVTNAKSLLYATGALSETSIGDIPYEMLNDTDSSMNLNPMSLRLKLLDIVDEETGRGVDFYDLPMDQRMVFVDKLLVEDATTISERIYTIPKVGELIQLENEATRALIEEYNIPILHIGDTPSAGDTGGGAPMSNSPGQRNTSYLATGESPAVDHKAFFSSLQEEINKRLNEQEENSQQGLRIIDVSFNYRQIDLNKVKSAWMESGRRGDFVLAIPHHDHPWTFLNVGKNVKFKVGHAGILNSKITQTTDKKDPVTIEAYSDTGVKRLNYSEWNTPHYIMGVQRVKYRWRWRGLKSGIYKKCTPVSNPGALADWGNRYVGREYVRWYEFLTAKWAAPKRFTCTTLVWWCAKKAYGINVSSWYSPLVTPSGLFTDDETYIRRDVR